MRKLLVIVLMLALVPFTTGCRIDGLWGFSDENENATSTTTTAAAVSTFDLALDLPANAAAASIRSNLSDSNFTYFVVYSDDTEDAMTQSYSATTGRVTIKKTGAKVKFSNDGTYYKVKIKIKDTVTGLTYNLEVKITVASITSATSLTTVKFDTFVIGANGLSFTYTVTFTLTAGGTTAGFTTGTTAITGTIIITATGATVTSVLVPLKVTAVIGSTESELNGTTAVTGVDWSTPKFKVYFNQAITAPTSFTLVASATSTTKKTNVTLTSSGGQIAVAVDTTDSKVLVVTVTGQNTGANTSLTPGESYSVAVTGTVVSADAKATLTIATAQTFLFKTASAKIVSWAQLNSAGTAVSGYDSTTGLVQQSTTGGFSVTFDYAMTLPSATDLTSAVVTRTNGTTVTSMSYNSYFNAPTLSSDQKTFKMLTKRGIFTPATTAGTKVYMGFASTFTPKDVTGTAMETTTPASFAATLQ